MSDTFDSTDPLYLEAIESLKAWSGPFDAERLLKEISDLKQDRVEVILMRPDTWEEMKKLFPAKEGQTYVYSAEGDPIKLDDNIPNRYQIHWKSGRITVG